MCISSYIIQIPQQIEDDTLLSPLWIIINRWQQQRFKWLSLLHLHHYITSATSVYTPGATGFNNALFCYIIIIIINQYPLLRPAMQNTNCIQFNNLLLCWGYIRQPACRAVQKQTWSNQTSFWFRLCGAGGGWRGGRQISFYWKEEKDGCLVLLLQNGERERAFHTFSHYSRSCRTVDRTLFVTPLHSRLSRRATFYFWAAFRSRCTAKHACTIGLWITGDESNWTVNRGRRTVAWHWSAN